MRDDRIAMLTGTVALLLLFGALAFQYLGNIAPCEMCQWQRWPLIATAAIGIGGALTLRKDAQWPAIVAILLVAVSGLIGAYQQGMQWHLLPGPSSCSGKRYVMGSNAIAVVQCDVVTWQVFGLSLAGYNALISLGTAVLAGVLLLKNRK